MNEREELAALRRLAELEAKASGMRAAPTAADETGALEAFAIGAGRTADRAVKGVQQYYQQARSALGSDEAKAKLVEMAAQEAENTRLYQQLAEARPVATGLGEAAPLMAIPMGGSVQTAMGAAAIPGLVEYGTPQEKLQRGALGAAGAGLVGGAAKLAGRVVNPVRAMPDAAQREAIEAAQRIGMPLTPGQQTGNYALRQIEARLGKAPIASGRMGAIAQTQQQALNRAASRAIGENADTLSDAVLDAAKARIGQQFQDVASRNVVNVGGDDLLNALVKVDTERAALGKFAPPGLASLIDKGLDLAAKGNVKGQTYQAIRSELGKQAEAAFNAKKSTLGDALKTVQRALDDAANASISAADRAAWKQAREQWQALKMVSKRAGTVEGGNVKMGLLANKADKTRNVLSQELRDIAKIGETIKPLPDSGTAQNALWQMLVGGGLGLVSPYALLGGIAGPAALQGAMFSPAGRRYLTEGLVKITPEIERRLVNAGGLLGLGATTALTP